MSGMTDDIYYLINIGAWLGRIRASNSTLRDACERTDGSGETYNIQEIQENPKVIKKIMTAIFEHNLEVRNVIDQILNPDSE